MKPNNLFVASVAILLLTSCGKVTVQSACYSNGDHANMSDGKITRICTCVSDRIAAQKFTERETSWVIALIEKESVKDLTESEKVRWKEVSQTFWSIKRGCESTG